MTIAPRKLVVAIGMVALLAPLVPLVSASPTTDGPIDAVAALTAARAAGLEVDVIVAYPVRCAKLPAPVGDPHALAAHDGVPISIAGFLRDDVGIAEAAAFFGPPVLCSHKASSTYADLLLAPTRPGIHAVTLETHDDELIGIDLELDPPAVVDLAALHARYGAGHDLEGPMDSREAGGTAFGVTTAGFTSDLMFMHRDANDPSTAWRVHQLIFRRTAIADSLPDRFHGEADVAQLIALALRAPAPEPVEFYGTLGAAEPPIDDHISFRDGRERNVAHASLERRAAAGPNEHDVVRAVTVAFATPIAVHADSLGAAVGALLHAKPTVTTAGAIVRIVVPGRGHAELAIARGAVTTVTVTRDAIPRP